VSVTQYHTEINYLTSARPTSFRHIRVASELAIQPRSLCHRSTPP